MPLFFFDTSDGDRHDCDEEGHDLPDAPAARELAMATLPTLVDDRLPDGDRRVFMVEVRDADGRPIYRAELVLTGVWLTPPAEA